MRDQRSKYFLLSFLLICAVALSSFAFYALIPILRSGFPWFSDDQSMIKAVAKQGQGLTASDWVIATVDNQVLVSHLSPELVRQLGSLNVEIIPLRDLPGALPILFLAGLSGLSLVVMRRNGEAERLKSLVLVVFIAAVGTEFYLWLWTVAADHDLSTPLQDARQIKLRGQGLLFWLKSLTIQILLCVGAILVLTKYLRENIHRHFISLVLAIIYALLTLGTSLLFRPEPYSRLLILSWWPLLFSLCLISCGLMSLFAIQRIQLATN